MSKQKIARYLHKIPIKILYVIGGSWFVFSLFSGSEEMAGGIKGVVLNSPNTIPWLLLLVFTYVASKKRLMGGILILATAVFLLILFRNMDNPLFVILTFILPLILLGLSLILSWKLSRK